MSLETFQEFWVMTRSPPTDPSDPMLSVFLVLPPSGNGASNPASKPSRGRALYGEFTN